MFHPVVQRAHCWICRVRAPIGGLCGATCRAGWRADNDCEIYPCDRCRWSRPGGRTRHHGPSGPPSHGRGWKLSGARGKLFAPTSTQYGCTRTADYDCTKYYIHIMYSYSSRSRYVFEYGVQPSLGHQQVACVAQHRCVKSSADASDSSQPLLSATAGRSLLPIARKQHVTIIRNMKGPEGAPGRLTDDLTDAPMHRVQTKTAVR
eukprot:COSAG01_NODE_9891_length_2310_cov_1.960651_1_plen_204_part_10